MNRVHKRQRSQWLQRLASYERALPSLDVFTEETRLDAEGCARIAVRCPEGLFDPMSSGEQRTLAPALYDFIDRMAYPIPVQYPLRIVFAAAPKAEREQISRLLKAHYALHLMDKRLDLRVNMLESLSLALLGAMLLGASMMINKHEVNRMLSEFLSVAATFSLWEAVGFFLLERKALRVERLNAGQLAMAEVVFEEGEAASAQAAPDAASAI
ncbi:MAG: hypothetical protein RR065_06695 [Clostridia bacterium]